ncbi:MAG: hypothetical protein ACHREM_14545 [Polyangiales bacterium]
MSTPPTNAELSRDLSGIAIWLGCVARVRPDDERSAYAAPIVAALAHAVSGDSCDPGLWRMFRDMHAAARAVLPAHPNGVAGYEVDTGARNDTTMREHLLVLCTGVADHFARWVDAGAVALPADRWARHKVLVDAWSAASDRALMALFQLVPRGLDGDADVSKLALKAAEKLATVAAENENRTGRLCVSGEDVLRAIVAVSELSMHGDFAFLEKREA